MLQSAWLPVACVWTEYSIVEGEGRGDRPSHKHTEPDPKKICRIIVSREITQKRTSYLGHDDDQTVVQYTHRHSATQRPAERHERNSLEKEKFSVWPAHFFLQSQIWRPADTWMKRPASHKLLFLDVCFKSLLDGVADRTFFFFLIPLNLFRIFEYPVRPYSVK